MFRLIKTLNNNGVLALEMEHNQEVILLGKGIGFGKKTNERFEGTDDLQVFRLQSESEKGNVRTLLKDINPVYLEITSEIIAEAEKQLDSIDRNILIPLADHIAYAVERMKHQGFAYNPLTPDIFALFPEEYQVALTARAIIFEATNQTINDDEVGFITLHLHAARDYEKVADVLHRAELIRTSINMIEEQMGTTINVSSLAYNRLLSHMKYMFERITRGEEILLDMNDYIRNEFAKTYELAEQICNHISEDLKIKVGEIEIGYLAIHIERVCAREQKNQEK